MAETTREFLDNVTVAALRQRRGEKWRQFGPNVLPAWVADMDFSIAQPIRTALRRCADESDCGYPLAAADTGVIEIFCERVARRFDWRIEPSQVDLFNDVVQAIYFGLLACSSNGDGVVIQTPIYPPFLGATTATGRRIVHAPLEYDDENGFAIDFAALRAACDETTRILLLCNPHNPAGRCFTRSELEQIAEIALRRDLIIISDEIHADLVYAPHRHVPIASLSADVARRTVTLMSASKAFNIAGICLAFAVFGDPALKQRFAQVPRHLRGGVSALSVAAVGAALRDGQPWLDEVLPYLRGNRDFVADWVNEHWPRIRHVRPQATYLAWLDCNALSLSPDPYRFFLERAEVALGNGARFGDPGNGCVRLNFATSREILTQVLTRMRDALARRA